MQSKLVSCPNCGELVSSEMQVCEYCGVNLALAALLAERKLKADSTAGAYDVISPEILVPLLGNYLVEKSVLNSDDLEFALKHQKELRVEGKIQLIGETLLDLGFITKDELDQAINEQIIEMHYALQQANLELENKVRHRTIELDYALNRLAELNELKANFLANISHELRTPLTHIRGYLELLINNELGSLLDDQVNALMVMKKSEERLEQLIDDLIQFSSAARGDFTVKIDILDLNQLLKDVILEAEKRCKDSGLKLRLIIPDDLPLVQADLQKISWVLSHLLDNSIKFTHDGGMIKVKTKVLNNNVLISVIDTGIGIEKNRLAEIFEPFHQLDSSASRRYGGTGLGLAMVKEIIDAHGSAITVKSKINVGTYIGFTLPISSQSSPAL
jgi:signal transduction histidine kinase